MLQRMDPTKMKLLAFCEEKHPEEAYNYYSPQVCALGQFFHSMGESYSDRAIDGSESSWTPELEGLARMEPHTFGALAKRIRSDLGGGMI